MPELDLLNLPDATVVANYRADSGITIATGVSAWADRSGNGYDLAQPTGGNQPALVSDGGSDFGGHPIIRFTAANNHFLFRDTTPAVSQPLTVVLIVKCTGVAGADNLFAGQGASTNPRIRYDTSEELDMYAGAVLGGSSPIGQIAVIEAYFNGTASELRNLSILEASGNAGADGLDGIRLGSAPDGSQDADMDLAELCVVDGDLTHADRVYLAQYANQRYGIALPFPQRSAVTATAVSSASTTHNVNLPAVKQGELQRIAIGVWGTGSSATAIQSVPGWQMVAFQNHQVSTGSWLGRAIFQRIAPADSAATTVNVQTAGDSVAAAQAWNVSLWYGDLASGTTLSNEGSGVSALPAPPSVTAFWGSARTLFEEIAFAADDDIAFTAGSTNYTGLTSTITGTGVNAACSVGTAYRHLEASGDNPGTMTLAESESWRAYTGAIRPLREIALGNRQRIMAGGL